MNTFDLKIGFKCNNDCVHCVVAEKRPCGELSLEELKNIVDTIPPSVDSITITGGEPTISPYFKDILKYCKSKGFKTSIQSNGTGFSSESLVKSTKDYIDHVHIAIHSSVESVHDSIVKSKGMWKKTIKGLDNLIKYNIHFTTQTVLSRLNVETLPETFAFIQSKKPGTQMSMTYPHMMGNAFENRADICFKYSEYKHIFHQCLKNYKGLIFTESIPPCILFPYEEYPNAILEVIIQKSLMDKNCRNRIGVDFSGTFDVIDYNFMDVKDRRKLPKCKDCAFNTLCIGVWKEYVDLYKNCIDLHPITKEMYYSKNKKGYSIC